MTELPTNLAKIQATLEQSGIDGWLFYDYENRDPIAYRVLGLNPNKLTTRRWFYLIPSEGEPIKLVHRIESQRLSDLVGRTVTYSGWQELRVKLSNIFQGVKKVAMQYSPMNDIPSISIVDAGTIELIRSFKVEVVSSANLVQMFAAKLSLEGMALHKQAGQKIQKIKDMTFRLIMNSVLTNKKITEYDAQQFILNEFKKENLTCEGTNPIVAVNEHAANPHFENDATNNSEIKPDDRILIDLWAKINDPNGVYYDITWCGFIGNQPPQSYTDLFEIVVQARNKAKNLVIQRLKDGKKVLGWEVDDIARNFIADKGYGQYFTHRTGHSIDGKAHGSGVNMDNLETKDQREIIPGVCFSIEPGIYKGEIGVRSEISVVVNENNEVIVVGPEQESLVLLSQTS